ncbi:aminotransferase class I/II-fold pyridoxal phosphate-dependent enzyme, partial [Nocardiopsis tropica]|nr:aminotransferase class I/II-fold pyridoxal phosphate-dependent enzyme [Nocardiopsis tropica]
GHVLLFANVELDDELLPGGAVYVPAGTPVEEREVSLDYEPYEYDSPEALDDELRRTGDLRLTPGVGLPSCPVGDEALALHPHVPAPHAAQEHAGHTVTAVLCPESRGFALDPAAVPEDADLVVVGNPTNPTGVLHPAEALRGLCRPGRLVVVDEAFMDALPGEPESLAGERIGGLVVLRSLTKHWSVPGIRAGYAVGDEAVVRGLARVQTPWSVSAPAIAATVACTGEEAGAEAERRAAEFGEWRTGLEAGLRGAGIGFVPSRAPFVLVKAGEGVHARLREQGIAVRRADTFPGLDADWVRVAVRPPETTRKLLAALSAE